MTRATGSMLSRSGIIIVASVLAASATACKRSEDATPPIATPSFSASPQKIPLGSPVEIKYRFVAGAGAPAAESLRVMVHFLDSDDEQLWTDDHEPPVPTNQWKPGQTVEYSRTVFIPIFPYVGPVNVHMGLYSARDGKRYPLNGSTKGQRSYNVGSLELVPRPEDAFIIFKDGWHSAEVSRENAAIEWQWTKREATLSFRNPRKDALFFLDLDGRPDLAGGPQDVTLRIGDTVVDRFTIANREQTVHKVPISASQFGAGDSVDLTLDVSRTFVPSLVPAAQSNDSRELGVRVFHAYIEPK